MTVGHVISSLSTGGAEIMLLRYIQHSDRSSVIFQLNGNLDLESNFIDADVTVINLPVDSILSARALNRARSIISSVDVNLLHAHLPSSMIVARVAGRAAGVNTVISTHHNSSYPLGLRAVERATRPLDSHEVAVSASVRDHQMSPLDRAEWSVIYNGIDVEGFNREVNEAPVESNLDVGEGPVFLNVGRYVPQKGQQYLVDAMAHVHEVLPEARVVIVGNGPLESALKSRAAALGLDEVVTVTGRVPSVEPYYAEADVFVFSSLFEGLPITGLEAMAAELPIVGTRVPGVTEVVSEGTTGVLVSPQDPQALANAMVEIVSNDPDLMGRRAFERASEQFSIEQMVAAHDALYDRLSTE